MPDININTIAMKALYSEGGVTRIFDNANYASPTACKKAAMAYRNMLYTLKARERRRQRRLSSGATEATVIDPLGATLEETPTGWHVTICKAGYDPAEFVDVNGKPIENWPDTSVEVF